MVSSGLVAIHPEHQALADETPARRITIRKPIMESIGRFVGDNRATSVAHYLSAVLTGLSVQARDGVPREVLADVSAEVVAGLAAMWPSFPTIVPRDER